MFGNQRSVLFLALTLALIEVHGFATPVFGQMPTGTLYLDSVPAYYYPPASPPNGTGFYSPYSLHINDVGQTVSTFGYHFENGQTYGNRAVEWDFGLGYRLLENVGDPDPNGFLYTNSTGINSAGQISGHEYVYDASSGQYTGYQPVIWDSATGTATQLGHLSSSIRNSLTTGINDTGAVCGYSNLTDSSGNDIGFRPVRWEAGATSPTQLELPGGTNLSGWTTGAAQAINASGTVIGWGHNWDSSGNPLPSSAIRWDAGTTTATVLANPSGQTAEHVDTVGLGITDSSFAWGQYIERFNGGTQSSTRAVRWDAAGNATLLQSLGTPADDSQVWYNDVFAMNNSGIAVGVSNYWDAAGNDLGQRAVKWDSNSDTAVELANLGTDSFGRTFGYAADINEAGLIAGSLSVFNSTIGYFENRAVIWLPNGTPIDLTTLPVAPVNGGPATWQLMSVNQLAADGWAAGFGLVDEDGAGSDYLPMYMTWSAQLGLGGVWVGPGGGARWGDGRNWSTGTPALEIGRAIFQHAGLRQLVLDRIVETLGIEVMSGETSLDVGGSYLTVREWIRIHQGARLNLRTIFEPENDLIGSVHGNIQNEGTFSPGNSPGLLNLNGDFINLGTMEFEISGIDPDAYDRLKLFGLFDADGTLKVVLDGYAPMLGDQFDLMNWDSFINRGLSFDFSQAQLTSGLAWDTSHFWSSGMLQIMAVPEPGGVALVLAGLAGLGVGFRVRRPQA